MRAEDTVEGGYIETIIELANAAIPKQFHILTII